MRNAQETIDVCETNCEGEEMMRKVHKMKPREYNICKQLDSMGLRALEVQFISKEEHDKELLKQQRMWEKECKESTANEIKLEKELEDLKLQRRLGIKAKDLKLQKLKESK